MAARITVIACLWVYMHMRAFMSVYLSVIYYVCWYVCTVELAVSIRITKMILAEPKNTNILLFVFMKNLLCVRLLYCPTLTVGLSLVLLLYAVASICML